MRNNSHNNNSNRTYAGAKSLRDPIGAAIEADIMSVGSSGLVDWLKKYYGMVIGLPAPLFMAVDAADPLDLIRSYATQFEPPTQALLTDAARTIVDQFKATRRDVKPMDFFLAARLAEVVNKDRLWVCLGKPLRGWHLVPPVNSNERVAVREAFESLFRSIDYRVEDIRLSGGSSILERRHFEPFEVVCRAAMLEMGTAPHPSYIAAHAPLFFLAVTYDIIFAQYDELTVIDRADGRLEVMASQFTKHADVSLARFESKLANGLGPYDLDAVHKTWPRFLALAFNKPFQSPEDPPAIDAPIRDLRVTEAGYHSTLRGADRLRARQLEHEDA